MKSFLEDKTYHDLDWDFKNICACQNKAKELDREAYSPRDYYELFRSCRQTYASMKQNHYFKLLLVTREEVRQMDENAGKAFADLIQFVQQQPEVPKGSNLSLTAFKLMLTAQSKTEVTSRMVQIAGLIKKSWQMVWKEFMAAKAGMTEYSPQVKMHDNLQMFNDAADITALVVFQKRQLVWIVKQQAGCNKLIANNLDLLDWTPASNWPWASMQEESKLGKLKL